MGIYSHILLTVDFDHTLTDTAGVVPAVNLEAIRAFMEKGGAFTINTGRSLPMLRPRLPEVPVNAPLLVYNGAMAYDLEKETVLFSWDIDLDPQAVIGRFMAAFPHLLVEMQGVKTHYIFRENPMWERFGRENRREGRVIPLDELPLPFTKLAVYGQLLDGTVAQFYRVTEQQDRELLEAEAWFRANYGPAISMARGAPRILDVQAAGTSKGAAARLLAKHLGRKTLVCVGDGTNDLSMLEEADLAFVPRDADPVLTAKFPQVCPCGAGAIADVIQRLASETELCASRAGYRK